jgi:RNA-directed DNA polymerase
MTVSTKQQRIAEIARKHPQEALNTLAHHMDHEWLEEAFRRTRRGGAPGVDGQRAAEYEENLSENLDSLLGRAKSGSYQAPPVKRAYIPKGDGREHRAIGIPSFEDKLLQRAVVMLLEPIYEEEFSDASYGFRPNRSAHQALEALWKQVMDLGGCWLVEVDIRKYFDTIDHRQLRALVRQRVQDGVIDRLIGKWLKAGVWEDGTRHCPEEGTPQGGVISPLLANIYLHEVLDRWFEEEVKPRMKGRAFLIRFADDFVLGFEVEEDARRVREVLPRRLERFGLAIQEAKTRQVDFRRPGRPGGEGDRTRESFNFLGFTHYWGKSRKGRWVVGRKTARDRLRRSLRAVTQWCRQHRHDPIRKQHAVLTAKMRGHYSYYGITGNSRALAVFAEAVRCLWRKWLDRRNRNHAMTWDRYHRLLECYPLPPPRIYHSALAAKP